jgi:hypothetical protein
MLSSNSALTHYSIRKVLVINSHADWNRNYRDKCSPAQLDYTNDAANHKIIQPHMIMIMILQICSYDQVPTDVSGHVILGKRNTFQTHCKPKLLKP